jgi:hypothetical protein
MSKYSEAQIKEIFHQYDKDKSGFLDLNELKQAMKGLGVAKSDADMEKLVCRELSKCFLPTLSVKDPALSNRLLSQNFKFIFAFCVTVNTYLLFA